MKYNFSNRLLILCVKYFYDRLRFKVVIDKSYVVGGVVLFSGHSVCYLATVLKPSRG